MSGHEAVSDTKGSTMIQPTRSELFLLFLCSLILLGKSRSKVNKCVNATKVFIKPLLEFKSLLNQMFCFALGKQHYL